MLTAFVALQVGVSFIPMEAPPYGTIALTSGNALGTVLENAITVRYDAI